LKYIWQLLMTPPLAQKLLHCVSKNVCHLICYNLENPEPIFIIFGKQYHTNPSL